MTPRQAAVRPATWGSRLHLGLESRVDPPGPQVPSGHRPSRAPWPPPGAPLPPGIPDPQPCTGAAAEQDLQYRLSVLRLKRPQDTEDHCHEPRKEAQGVGAILVRPGRTMPIRRVIVKRYQEACHMERIARGWVPVQTAAFAAASPPFVYASMAPPSAPQAWQQ